MGERIMRWRQRIVRGHVWDSGFGTRASGGEARQTFADRLCRFRITGDGEFEPTAVAQLGSSPLALENRSNASR